MGKTSKYYPELWMNHSSLEEEKKVVDLLHNRSLNMSEKAKRLGYKRTTVNLDGKRRTAYVDGGFDLVLSLKNLIKQRKEFPLGFDFYYWGYECYKSRDENNDKSN